MNCQRYQDELIEFAKSSGGALSRRPVLAAHILKCNECTQYLKRQQALQVSFEALVADTNTVSLPQAIEARVLAEFDAVRRTHKRRRRWWAFATPAMATGVVVAAFLIHRSPLTPKVDSVSTAAAEQVFLTMPYVIPPAPYERTEVVRMEVPLAVLAAEGFEVHVPDMGASVTADVLCGQDGRALAIRFLNGSHPDSKRRNNL